MQRVFKYGVECADTFTIELPKNASILSLQIQNYMPYIWVLVNEEMPMETRRFRLVGTGHDIKERIIEFIGTFQMQDGKLVFHLFEIE